MRRRAFPLLILLAGCSPVKPVAPPRVVHVAVPTPVPVDKRLTQHCAVAQPRDRTVAEAVRVARERGASLEQCNHQLDEISATH